MSRMTPFSSPLMLGFDGIEKTLDRIAKGGDGYPPYNIERVRGSGRDRSVSVGGASEIEEGGTKASEGDIIRITLAVAGFSSDDLEILNESNQLIVRGRQSDESDREYLHRGIAARQFQKAFLLADGMVIMGAALRNGLLQIDLAKPEPERTIRRIAISVGD